MGSFEKDFKDLGVTEKLSFCKASIFFLFLHGFRFCISPSNLLGEVLKPIYFCLA